MNNVLMPDDPIVARAIDWLVLLGSGDACPADSAAFQQWRAQDPRHDAAAARLELSLKLFDRLPADKRASSARLLQTKPHSEQRRHLLTGVLGVGLLALGSGLVLHRYQPVSGLLADASTGTAERQKITLPDGSELLLNARSTVDWEFKPNTRKIHLRAGEVIARVAPDAHRPFEIITTEGTIRAFDARFLVQQDSCSSLVSAMESSIQLQTHQGKELHLKAGNSARLTASEITLEPRAASSFGAWEDGFIELHDRPLAELVTALRAYRPGVLRISPAAAQLRITGSFSLDKSDQTLAVLPQVLPIEITYNTGYWVSIDMRTPAT